MIKRHSLTYEKRADDVERDEVDICKHRAARLAGVV